MTPLAQAAAEVAGTAPAAPAGPMADPVELAALELLLADPANQEMIEHFGGELQPLPTWTSVGQGIEARYGADLAARLNQLQTAQRAVDDKFFAAMDQAQQNPPAQPAPMPPRKGQSTPTSDQPGWLYDAGSGHADGGGPSWKFDPGAFARHYAQGDSPAQRAFAHLHGAEPLQFVPAPNTEAGGVDSWQLSGLTVRLGRPVDSEEGLTPEAFHAQDGWVQSGVLRPEHHLDPNRITKLNNKEFVWFDPVHGFSTDPKNLRGSWIDRAFPQIMGVAFGVIGAGVVGHLVSAAGTVAQGAAAGAAGSALNQFVSTGQVNFKQVLNSALAGGLTAGVTQMPGVGRYIDGAANTPLARLLEYTGKATLQGAIQSITGGQFKDGFVNSLMGSVAGEISAHIDAQISQMPGLSASEQSALRLLGNATSSALRAVANPGDPLMGVAGDFLSQVMGDVVQQEMQHVPPPPADPLGDFIAANEERRAVRQAIAELLDEALDAPHTPTDDRVLLAAGDGFLGGFSLPESWRDSSEFAHGFVEGGGISILQSFETLASLASEPRQFIDGIYALITSPEARSQFGADMLRGVEVDIQMFRDAYEAGDMRIAGQQFGKLTADVAQLAGGVEALVRAVPALARGVGRGSAAIADAAADLRFGGSSGGNALGGARQRGGVKFPANDDQISHIFNNRPGHIPDTPVNRALISELVRDGKNLLGSDKFGNQWYQSILPDGTQIWASVRNGVLQNGGINNPPRSYNSATGLAMTNKPGK